MLVLAEIERRRSRVLVTTFQAGAAAAHVVDGREGPRHVVGSLKLVDAVAPSPTCLVTSESAAISVVGSNREMKDGGYVGLHRQPSRR